MSVSTTSVPARRTPVYRAPLPTVPRPDDPLLNLPVLWAVALVALSLALVGVAEHLSLRLVCVAATLILLGAVVPTLFCTPRGLWSCTSIYLIVFSVFHFGLVVLQAIGFEADEAVGDMSCVNWFYTDYANQAIAITATGAAALCLGSLLTATPALGSSGTVLPPALPRLRGGLGACPRRDAILSAGGLCAMSLGMLVWFSGILSSGGLRLLISSYRGYLDVTEQSQLFRYVWLGVSLGLVLLAASSDGAARRMGFLLFGICALAAMSLGLRGQVLFPAAAAAATFARRRPPISATALLVLACLLLPAISIVRQIRIEGIGDTKLSHVSGSMTEGLAELGGSIRPVVEVVRWRAEGDSLAYGRTYWHPTYRVLAGLIPALNCGDAEDDEMLIRTLLRKRVGNIGFSNVAEAYRNGGVIGTLLVTFGIGWLLRWMDSTPSSPFSDATVGVLMLSLLSHVRHSFIQVPMYVIVGLFLVALLRKLDRASKAMPQRMIR